jgi:hypothetical protein
MSGTICWCSSWYFCLFPFLKQVVKWLDDIWNILCLHIDFFGYVFLKADIKDGLDGLVWDLKFSAWQMWELLYILWNWHYFIVETCRQQNLLSWRWWQQVPLKYWHLFTWICGLMSQTAASCRFVWFWTWSRSGLLWMWVWHSVVWKLIHIF